MNQTLQLEEALQLHEAPKLLIEWTPRWEDFVTSIRPALARSTARLAGEAAHGVTPYRKMLATWVAEAFLIFVAIILPVEIARLRPYVAPQPASRDVIYYTGDELPRTEDLGGSQSGTSGRAGGAEAHHRTQTIKIARGGSLVERVVDAPNLKLPASRDAVANLLAVKANPGPPPSEGLRSSRSVPNLPANIVAPAPNVTRDYTRNGLSVETIVPPAPNVSRERPLTAPDLNSSVIAPAPSVSREHALVAPLLAPSVVAPAPNLSRDRARSAPALNASIIPPAPAAVSRDVSRSAVQMTNAAVIPPPVSSPERETMQNPKLTLPAPSVIAPPPSADLSPDMRRLASGSIPDPSKSVVPPPPAPTGSGSLVSSLIGKIFGTTDVVPPPPTVSSTASSGNPNGVRGGSGNSLGASVVPPPPSISGAGAASGRSASAAANGQPGGINVVPPPPSLAGSARGSGNAQAGNGTPGGTLLAGNVVPPPPSIGGGTAALGSGRGANGTGFGGPMDSGSVIAPPSGGGSGGGAGAVISSQPGSKVGVPIGTAGSLSMSPSGGDHPGLGGSGGGAGIGRGNGPGSGMTGEGTGAGKTGTGRGSDPSAHGGISPTAGPGGAGSAAGGTPAVPGVSVTGGSTIVTLPSFGSDGGSGNPSLPGRTSIKEQQGPAITIVATSRSGGAFDFYGKLPGDNYTVYVDTSAGTVVMQFADPTSASHPYAGTLIGPQAIRSDLPSGLPRSRLVISCVLDASGNLKNLRVLEPGPAAMTANVMAALPSWKFRPALRGKQPVEVNAILGFGIDTNDRH